MNNIKEAFDDLLMGKLDSNEEAILLNKIAEDPELRKAYAAEKASRAAFEMQISEDTRDFLSSLSDKLEEDGFKGRRRLLFVYGIAASLFLLILSTITINISHNDQALAAAYKIQSVHVRSADSQEDILFNSALKSYYDKDFKTADSKLSETHSNETIISDNISWLQMLITLEMEGSKSDSFKEQLKSIKNNEKHEFHHKALALDKELNMFWMNFVVNN